MKNKLNLGIALLVFGGSMLLGVVPASAHDPTSGQKPVKSSQLADQQQLAFSYHAEAQESLKAYTKQQRLVNFWRRRPWMTANSKVPNPYWSARTQASSYRAQWMEWSRRAAAQDKIVAKLRSTTPRP